MIERLIKIIKKNEFKTTIERSKLVKFIMDVIERQFDF